MYRDGIKYLGSCYAVFNCGVDSEVQVGINQVVQSSLGYVYKQMGGKEANGNRDNELTLRHYDDADFVNIYEFVPFTVLIPS